MSVILAHFRIFNGESDYVRVWTIVGNCSLHQALTVAGFTARQRLMLTIISHASYKATFVNTVPECGHVLWLSTETEHQIDMKVRLIVQTGTPSYSINNKLIKDDIMGKSLQVQEVFRKITASLGLDISKYPLNAIQRDNIFICEIGSPQWWYNARGW